jgi:hypothetical protein
MNKFNQRCNALFAAISLTLCALLKATNYFQEFTVDPVTNKLDCTPPESLLGFAVMIFNGLGTAILPSHIIVFTIKEKGVQNPNISAAARMPAWSYTDV